MNFPQLHLMLNHVPIVGFIAAYGLLLYALWRRSAEARRIALAGMFLSGLIILPVLITGNVSEDVVENLPGVVKAAIGRHEDAADYAAAMSMVAGAAAFVALLLDRWRPRHARLGVTAVLVLALLATAALARTAHLGGQIRHPEIAFGWQPPAGHEAAGAAEAAKGTQARERRERDHD
jgi:hypothetical protein